MMKSLTRRHFLSMLAVSGGAFLTACMDGKHTYTSDQFAAWRKKSASLDTRNILNGNEIPTDSYADQPYIVRTDDNAWLCVLTTGAGNEGQSGQHVTSLRSLDQGKTWTRPVDIEPADGPEASYAVLLKVPQTGRVFVFYTHNTDNIREVIADEDAYPSGFCTRVDSLGFYVFKYSDDHGRSWSEKRYPIPVREFEIDRENPYKGTIRFFWNVGKPFIHQGCVYVPLCKVGGFGKGFFTRVEGVLLKSDNLLTENQPEMIHWETLPDGEVGLRTPPLGGPIAAEQSYSVLSDGSFFVVYRTVDGHPAVSYSRDAGHTWDIPRYMQYADGRLVKHPRAANFAWKCANGKYLYWYHNHGGKDFNDRNPVWVLGGEEVDGNTGREIRWTQPEVLLYSDDTTERISYPDLVQEDGNDYITETQKDIARVHLIDSRITACLWSQFHNENIAEGDVLFLENIQNGAVIPAPQLPVFWNFKQQPHCCRSGFTIEFSVMINAFGGEQILFDGRDENGIGMHLKVTEFAHTIGIDLFDGQQHTWWECDRGILKSGEWIHAAVIVDSGPCILSWIVNGQFCDGGTYRQFGWGRFSPEMTDVNGAEIWRIAPDFDGEVGYLRVYDRALHTSEVIGNYHAFCGLQKV